MSYDKMELEYWKSYLKPNYLINKKKEKTVAQP